MMSCRLDNIEKNKTTDVTHFKTDVQIVIPLGLQVAVSAFNTARETGQEEQSQEEGEEGWVEKQEKQEGREIHLMFEVRDFLKMYILCEFTRGWIQILNYAVKYCGAKKGSFPFKLISHCLPSI